MAKPAFTLQFPGSLIPALAARYTDKREPQALEAGERVRKGSRLLSDLLPIYDWKTGGRGRERFKRNLDADLIEAVAFACGAARERTAIAALCGLPGVHIPVASAILTAIFPERYTIIDWRALESLGALVTSYSIEFYLSYLSYCRNLAETHEVSLRDLDRALWQRSYECGLKKPADGSPIHRTLV